MKNKKKYAKEILDIACKGRALAMNMNTKRLCMCTIGCENCYFSSYNYPHNQGDCTKNLVHWANAEYKEPKIFTDREKAFVKLFPEIKYLARDDEGKLFAYRQKPFKDEEEGWWVYKGGGPDSVIEIRFWTLLRFESIQWEDEEPTSREEILGGNDE